VKQIVNNKMRTIVVISLLLIFFQESSARCDNACSGHGTCNIKSKCDCYDNFGLGMSHDSGDCSDRICPYDISWVDKPDKTGAHHKYSECSSQGICDRGAGACQCFPGYEGIACQRTSCPNDCSGNGVCAYVNQMGYGEVAADYKTGSYLPQDPETFQYIGWDSGKIRGCICDPEYGDADCSKRMCPYGNDVMDIRLNSLVPAKYQIQQLTFVADNNQELNGKTFALTFKSKLNETFTTRPIVFDSTPSGFPQLLEVIEMALEELPNKVIDDVEVLGNVLSLNNVILNISFIGDYVQGPQNLLTVESFACGDGCTPKITGLPLLPTSQNVTQLQSPDFNNYECGRRGKCDYTSGICNCYAGYTGPSCNVITALV
jgi:hypothetical protein